MKWCCTLFNANNYAKIKDLNTLREFWSIKKIHYKYAFDFFHTNCDTLVVHKKKPSSEGF